jgi:hypothetical protein
MLLSIKGAYDLHIHTAPCLFPRLATDREMVLAAREYGMGGVMLKCHHEASESRAALLNAEFDDIDVFGGIVLNTCVGGLNPAAVDAALRLGGKAVWFPTFDSRRHVEVHGVAGKYAMTEKVTGTTHDGISMMEDGKLKPESIAVMEMAKQYDVFLGTGHSSEEECFALADLAKDIGFKKLLIQHAHYKVPNIGSEGQKVLIEKGATIELGYCTVAHGWAANTVDNAANAIKENGAENYILVSDAGQYNNPMPAESLRIFAQTVYERGVSPDDMKLLMITNPKRLLNL